MNGYKHYIRTDQNGIVIKGFTDGFEQPIAGDLLLSGYEDERHFQLQLTNERGQYRFKVIEGTLVERTQSELDTEWASRPPAPPTQIELMQQQIDELTIALGDALLGGGI